MEKVGVGVAVWLSGAALCEPTCPARGEGWGRVPAAVAGAAAAAGVGAGKRSQSHTPSSSKPCSSKALRKRLRQY